MRKVVGVVVLMMVLSMVMVVGVAGADTAQPAAAQAQAGTPAGEYMDVSGLVPFSAAANYMSLTGYLRWTVLRDQHVMLTRVEAQRIVTAQQQG
jgi:hypothetical protein